MASRLRLAAFLTLLFALSTALHADQLLREPGAIYLEDLIPKPLKVNVMAEAPIFYDIGMERYLGTLRKGQLVELLAVADHAFRVKGQAQQGQVAGWVDPRYLGELRPNFLASLKKAARRQEDVKALIERKEVAINMTPEEVGASLGKPGKVSSRLDASGRHLVWEFIRYELQPQQSTVGTDRFGNPVSGVVYVKVPVGQLSVIFENNLVTALDQSEQDANKNTATRVVDPPVDLN